MTRANRIGSVQMMRSCESDSTSQRRSAHAAAVRGGASREMARVVHSGLTLMAGLRGIDRTSLRSGAPL
jgi:hypothetical protein